MGIGAMEVPERVKRGYFVKNLFALSVSMHINLADNLIRRSKRPD
jgi:hypothetical protein